MKCGHVGLEQGFKCTSVLPFQAETEDRSTPANKTPTIELALFFDAAGYQLFMPYFSGDEAKLRDMLLAYMNGVWCMEHRKYLSLSAQEFTLYLC